MFTFHWSELLVVVVCGLILFLGLAILMLRRRNEILQQFLTPDEPHLEEEFFRVHSPEQEPPPLEIPTEPEQPEEAAPPPDTETIRWGAPAEH